MSLLDKLVAASPDPHIAGGRLERLREDVSVRRELDALEPAHLDELLAVISISNVLFHFLCRHPETLRRAAVNTPGGMRGPLNCGDLDALRVHKYRELYRITAWDMRGPDSYEVVLDALSVLAESVLNAALELCMNAVSHRHLESSLCIFALGKLGAGELNYSSDLDLVFVSDNFGEGDIANRQKRLLDGLRRFTREMENRTVEGFLYRIDLNLRPWGRSGPLFMAIDDTEHYYEAGADAWERFAWLRARPVAGARRVGEDLLQRLGPFLFLRSLSSADLDRFVEIKNEMARIRQRRGHWNVKLGDGGIRDIEFFVQTLQVVNAARHPALRTTSTLGALRGLVESGIISRDEEVNVRGSYLFLRRLENRLQMFDEQQTHELPDDPAFRLVLARSLGNRAQSQDEILDEFESRLHLNRSIARAYFERILPGPGSA